MSDLTVALTGVVAGALASGIIQVLQHERERRLARRAAARLLFGDLARAEHDIEQVLHHGRWPLSGRLSFERQLRVWEENRKALAVATNAADWTRIAMVYGDLADFEFLPATTGELHEGVRDSLRAVNARLDAATIVLAKHMAPRWQRRRAERDLRRDPL